MGKISDALERHKKESVSRFDELPKQNLEPHVPERKANGPVKEIQVGPRFSKKVVVQSAPNSVDAENFKLLRAQLLFPKEGAPPRTIMITSTFPGEGKSYVASNLAVSIAQGLNEHVLLVDCDLRRPSQQALFGYSGRPGLSEHLMQGVELTDLIIRTTVEKLSILPAGGATPKPTEALASQAMKDFLREVRERYDDRYIVIDSTPSHVTAEASILANFVDTIVFVVMAEKTPRETIKRSIENLGKKKIFGIVFNGYNQSYKPYHRYYRKYYKDDE